MKNDLFLKNYVYFRGSRFSQRVILYSQSRSKKGFMLTIFLRGYQVPLTWTVFLSCSRRFRYLDYKGQLKTIFLWSYSVKSKLLIAG